MPHELPPQKPLWIVAIGRSFDLIMSQSPTSARKSLPSPSGKFTFIQSNGKIHKIPQLQFPWCKPVGEKTRETSNLQNKDIISPPYYHKQNYVFAQSPKSNDNEENDESKIANKPENAIVFFSGAKTFWRSGIVVDFKLVDHKDCSIIELIIKIKAESINAPRYYFLTPLLYSKFDREKIKERMKKKREMLLDLYFKTDSGLMSEYDLRESVLRDFVVEYIDQRLYVSPEGENNCTRTPQMFDST